MLVKSRNSEDSFSSGFKRHQIVCRDILLVLTVAIMRIVRAIGIMYLHTYTFIVLPIKAASNIFRNVAMITSGLELSKLG